MVGEPLWRISRADLDKLMGTMEVASARLSECLFAAGACLHIERGNLPTIHYGLTGSGMIGLVPGWPKFLVMNPSTEEYEGFLADDLKNFEEKMGIKVEFVATNWAGIVAGLQSGTYDVMVGAGITPEQAAVVAFGRPYAFFKTSALTGPDSTAQSLADLDQECNVLSSGTDWVAGCYLTVGGQADTPSGPSDHGAALLFVRPELVSDPYEVGERTPERKDEKSGTNCPRSRRRPFAAGRARLAALYSAGPGGRRPSRPSVS